MSSHPSKNSFSLKKNVLFCFVFFSSFALMFCCNKTTLWEGCGAVVGQPTPQVHLPAMHAGHVLPRHSESCLLLHLGDFFPVVGQMYQNML